MKRYSSIICFLLALPLCLFSQEPLVKWGEPIEQPANSNSKIQQLMNTAEPGCFYAFRKTSTAGMQESYLLDKYDSSYKLVFSKEIPAAEGVMGDGIDFRKILALKDRFLAFYTGYKKASKESSFLARSFSVNGEIDKTNIVLERLTVEKQMNSGSFDVVLSPDKSKLLLLTTFPTVKDQKAKIRLKAFDTQSMKELWVKEVDLNYDGKKGSCLDMLADNAGNAYVIQKYSTEGRKYEFNLATYTVATGTWKENFLNVGEKVISDQYRLLFNSMGDVIYAGLLHTKSAVNYAGLFYVRVNGKTQAMDVFTTLGFGDTNNKEKEDETFAYWKLKDIVSQSNGTILLFGEKEDVTNIPPTVPGSFDYTYKYDTRAIKIAAIKPDGSKAWIKSIWKNETCTVPDQYKRWDSFIYGFVNDRLYILYNNKEAVNHIDLSTGIGYGWKENDGTIYHMKDFAAKTISPTFLYIVEPNGDLTYGDKKYGLPLFNFQKGIFYDMYLNAALFQPLPDGILMLDEMPQGQRYQFGKIVF